MVNFILGDLVSRLKVASRGHLKSIKIRKTNFSIEILAVLYKNGLIRGFFILNNEDSILVFLKYFQNRSVFYSIDLVSKPGRRVYWNLGKLSLKYNANTFAGFYIISSSSGLITSNDCLLVKHISGEVLLKVYV